MSGHVITHFILAWNNQDIEKIMSFFSEDALYTNIPMGPANQGKEAIHEFISLFLDSVTELEFIVHNQVENDHGMVMNERTDTFMINNHFVSLPVMGIFIVKDDLIYEWRDYFDMAPLHAAGL